MSMQAEGNDAKGRNFHQSTKDGTGSAASVGVGGTGDSGAMGGETAQGSVQSASRSDDLLAGSQKLLFACFNNSTRLFLSALTKFCLNLLALCPGSFTDLSSFGACLSEFSVVLF